MFPTSAQNWHLESSHVNIQLISYSGMSHDSPAGVFQIGTVPDYWPLLPVTAQLGVAAWGHPPAQSDPQGLEAGEALKLLAPMLERPASMEARQSVT